MSSFSSILGTPAAEELVTEEEEELCDGGEREFFSAFWAKFSMCFLRWRARSFICSFFMAELPKQLAVFWREGWRIRFFIWRNSEVLRYTVFSLL